VCNLFYKDIHRSRDSFNCDIQDKISFQRPGNKRDNEQENNGVKEFLITSQTSKDMRLHTSLLKYLGSWHGDGGGSIVEIKEPK
jgi:hypothetical protein